MRERLRQNGVPQPLHQPIPKGRRQLQQEGCPSHFPGYCGGKCSISYTATQMKTKQKVVCTDDTIDCGSIHKSFEGFLTAEDCLYKNRAPVHISTDVARIANAD